MEEVKEFERENYSEGEMEVIEEEEEKHAEREEEKEEPKIDEREIKLNLIREKIEFEEEQLNDMRNTLYNPDFLYKILTILYKCLLKNNDEIVMAAGNPKYIAIALDLLRTAPPTHRILLIKIVNILV